MNPLQNPFEHVPLGQSLPVMHGMGAQVLLPLHVVAGHSLSGSIPDAMGSQRPSAPCPFFAALQATQVPVQAVLQQTPSRQKFEAHVADDEHALPMSARQDPEPLHERPPHSASGSFPFTILSHTPFCPLPFLAAEQATHVPLQEALQQNPSTQYPDKHIALFEQVCALSSWHVLAPLHAPLTHSLSGSEPLTIGPHIPFEPFPFLVAVQASHVPAHAVSQQTPSAQCPDAH